MAFVICEESCFQKLVVPFLVVLIMRIIVYLGRCWDPCSWKPTESYVCFVWDLDKVTMWLCQVRFATVPKSGTASTKSYRFPTPHQTHSRSPTTLHIDPNLPHVNPKPASYKPQPNTYRVTTFNSFQKAQRLQFAASHYIILCYTNTILHYTIPYHTILYYTVLYYNILYYTILYYTILY